MCCIVKCAAALVLKIICWVLSLLKTAASVAIIIIVAIHLTDVTVTTTEDLSVETSYTCYLGITENETDLCVYAYAVCGLSIVSSLVISLFLCCTYELCGLGFIVEGAFALVGTVWWLVASLVFSKYVAEANNDDLELKNWRNSVVVLSWFCFGCFAFVMSIILIKMLAKIWSCCSCCNDDGDKAENKV
mmetsp:Transcript_35098/g.78128  ORF Transcript_35098/g.78128 Transcript_35098/m.78128 type:complete len:189 (-) Transcript_35098:152-718(-)|eukprot:CAMPEP_0202919798 /NCGR_PEP_ID=MMETSP1392-20130828/76520_1 /ASSEMBLY_ACC=CAM_ASM_000868 /TAXON_ID=225041 /ORGANISM="Chlamydomonas chlamydogama, Strain SAG 11-48b" /LENGTH=188 /DNA_ID=CAMNT_0049613257 /DNA_START=75 /DNA_END=641 /DNA_ORIENTATION=+